MGPAGRDGAPLKKRKNAQQHSGNAKRPRKAVAVNADESTDGSNSNDRPKKAKGSSLLNDEERAFPRGGASILTPFEQKQIQLKAQQDVLFEEAGLKKPPGENLSEDEDAEAGQAEPKKSSKKRKKTKIRTEEGSLPAEEKVKTGGLKFKRLLPGSMVLGQITRISDQDLILDIPNNLTGTVPLTSISTEVTKQVEALASFEGEGDEDTNTGKDEDFELRDMFQVGQYLRASVLSTVDDLSDKTDAKAKKKIELSIEPQKVNRGIAPSNICTNSMLQASVASVEDHGVIMNLGLEDSSTRGFMSSNELPSGCSLDKLKPGAVWLCLVTGLSSNGKIVKLSGNTQRDKVTKVPVIRDASTVDILLPGTVAELLVTQTSKSGIAGKLIGLVDASADIVHSGSCSGIDVTTKYKKGAKINVRITYSTADGESHSIGISLLDHIMRLSAPRTSRNEEAGAATDVLPLSEIVQEAKVIRVDPSVGVYLDVGIKNALAYVHKSRVSDSKKEISEDDGAFKLGTIHRARILGYNVFDGLFTATLEQSVLDQPFLRLEDVPVGEVVKATVQKLVFDRDGAVSVLLSIAGGITGLVPALHLADVSLQYPERRFKEGVSVTARVFLVDKDKRQIRLTLKKSLVNSDALFWSSFDEIATNSWCPGTIVKLTNKGALLRFFGSVKGFLPAVEMSSDWIGDPTEHFRLGQTLNVRAKSVHPSDERLTLSCRTDAAEDPEQVKAFERLRVGEIVSGEICAKSLDDVTIKLEDSKLKARLRLGHLTDGTKSRNESVMKPLRLGQILDDLVIIELFAARRSIVVSQKPSLIKAAKNKTLLTKLEDASEGAKVEGYVRNITAAGTFIQFGGGLVGLLPAPQIPEETAKLPDFGFSKDQSISPTVLTVNIQQDRFILTLKQVSLDSTKPPAPVNNTQHAGTAATVNPVDQSMKTTSDFTVGKVTMAKISSVKDTQLNVMLADNVQGRIDISEAFTDFESIKDRKYPLRQFRAKQVLPVKILGVHDAKSHSFLPISHRGQKFPVFELSAKVDSTDPLFSLEQIQVGSWYTAFVNNTDEHCIWVNLSPSVRGRLGRMEASHDVSKLNDLGEHFPAGSVLRVRVTEVDIEKGRLDLSAKSKQDELITYNTISAGMILTGRVTKVTERSVLVQLNKAVAGQIPLTELADDYTKADTGLYNKNDVVRVCVVDVNKANKRLTLSSRPSKVLSSSLPVADPAYSTASQLKVNDIVRGFIKHVADIGVFISISYRTTGFVPIPELSDAYIKDWKASFEIDRFVTSKVLSIDETSDQVKLSLKQSVLDSEYVKPLSFTDLKKGQVVTGKIRKVEDFGAFVVIDNSNNVSGLCHRSEIAEQRVEDVRKLYSEGDRVKAIVLKIEPEKRRISFGLKASYFENASDDDSADDSGVDLPVIPRDSAEDEVIESEVGGGVSLERSSSVEQDGQEDEPESNTDEDDITTQNDNGKDGLEIAGFDWNAGFPRNDSSLLTASSSESEHEDAPKKKRRKPTVKVDATGDLDAYGPRSSSDFERLLLSQRDSSSLWIQYMAYQLEQGEIDEARNIAERALREIGIREQEEKMNVWIAFLNLENAYGTDENLEEVFKRACSYNDSQQIHERLTSIYIESGKLEKAEDLFRTMIRNKQFNAQVPLWVNFATFLLTTLNDPARARSILDRAMQSVPAERHRDLVTKFGALEFQSPNGDPERGRTIFEGLLSTYSKNWDLWDMLIELEEGKRGDKSNVRKLYERMSTMSMKSRRAKKMFKRWLEFEEKHGSEKNMDKVKAKAADFVEEQHRRQDAQDTGDE